MPLWNRISSALSKSPCLQPAPYGIIFVIIFSSLNFTPFLSSQPNLICLTINPLFTPLIIVLVSKEGNRVMRNLRHSLVFVHSLAYSGLRNEQNSVADSRLVFTRGDETHGIRFKLLIELAIIALFSINYDCIIRNFLRPIRKDCAVWKVRNVLWRRWTQLGTFGFK